MRQAEMQREALTRARSGVTLTNYPAIYSGFMSRGIAESDIEPRVNVLTYQAWRAVGRQVRKGEKGVRVITYIETKRTVKDRETGEETERVSRRPWTSTVFHVSQTDERVAS
jgi:antirestriction protein ArdC